MWIQLEQLIAYEPIQKTSPTVDFRASIAMKYLAWVEGGQAI